MLCDSLLTNSINYTFVVDVINFTHANSRQADKKDKPSRQNIRIRIRYSGVVAVRSGHVRHADGGCGLFCGRRDREPYRRFDDGPRPPSLRHGAYRPQKQIFGQSSRSQRTSARKQSLNDCRASGSKYIKYFRRYEL